MRKQILAFLLCLLLSPVAMFAQQTKTVKGTVVDESNMPVIGVTVKVNGSSIVTATDLDGNYVLSNVPADAVITYSYIGMKSQEVKTAGQTVINVTLKEDSQNLEEVVVIGYGAAKAKDLTAPITVVKGEDLLIQPTSSPMAALQGKVPGVNITNSGTPGAGPTVKIRGVGSFSDSTPLYVVDGMFYDNIDFLNNADIQEMSILKDASAAAIYGVRAANGVVIITTKKGRRGQKAQITYNGYVGLQTATNVLEMTNSSQYAQMLREAGENVFGPYLQSAIAKWGGDYDKNIYGADTDWYDELLRTAVITNHSLSVAGGSENATYSVGMSYLSQDGIMDVDNYYRRMNFRAALDYDATNWLKVGFNGVFSNSQQQLPKNAAWQQAYNMAPIMPVYDESPNTADVTGGYASPQDLSGISSNLNNPVASANYYDSRNENYQALSNFYAQFTFIPDKLTFRTSYSYDFSLTKGRVFTPEYYISSWQKQEINSLQKMDTNYHKAIWDNTLSYNDQWGDHKFGAMVGHSARWENYRYLSGTVQGIPEGADEFMYWDQGSMENRSLDDDGHAYRGLSFFTRLNYDYMGKYLLMFTFRADGSSKYQEKWGYFPSVGAAWVITGEEFMQNQTAFDYMKLRASWGRLGNDKVAASDGFASLTTGIGSSNVFNGTIYDGWQNTTYFSWLRWELVDETNIGLQFTTLDNRFDVDADWYYRMTKNAVVRPQIPMTNEYVAKNTGEILNTGVDLQLTWHDKIGEDFSYYVGANLAYLHNEVKSLDGGLSIVRGGKTVNMVGEKMNSYYGYKVLGVYQNQAQINADPIAVENGLEPGDLIYEDRNGDGKLDGLDKQTLGSYVPDFTYGFNLGFSYKNFDFALTTYGQVGGELWNRKRSLRYACNYYNFDLDSYENRWHGEGTSNTHPSAKGLTKGWNVSDQNISSYFVEKSDYFRIQNITLGYTFKNVKMGSYTMPGIRLSLTADRPFTTFKANSFTPELSDPEGWDTEVYPLTATYTFGVQLDF